MPERSDITPPFIPPHQGEGDVRGARIARARSLRKRMPPMESKLWNALRELKPLGFHFRRQVPLGRYFADFACHSHRLVVEVDGPTHTSPRYDSARDSFMRNEGYRVLRVTNEEVGFHLDGVMTAILYRLDPSFAEPATPSPSPLWGGIKGGGADNEQDPEGAN